MGKEELHRGASPEELFNEDERARELEENIKTLRGEIEELEEILQQHEGSAGKEGDAVLKRQRQILEVKKQMLDSNTNILSALRDSHPTSATPEKLSMIIDIEPEPSDESSSDNK